MVVFSNSVLNLSPYMSAFDYQAELQKMIENKQLVEVSFYGAPTFKVAYLLNVNEEYLTFAEVSSSATFSGVILCRMNSIDWIASEAIYLDELSKRITDDSMYQQAQENIKSIKKFTPSGFLSAFAETQTIVELTDEDENIIAGRIIGYGKQHVLIDEYASEHHERVARKYVDVVGIARIAIDVPWLRTIALFLADRGL